MFNEEKRMHRQTDGEFPDSFTVVQRRHVQLALLNIKSQLFGCESPKMEMLHSERGHENLYRW